MRVGVEVVRKVEVRRSARMVGVRDSIMAVVATVWRSSRWNLDKSFCGGVELDGGLLVSDGSLRLEVSVSDLAA